MFASAIKYDIDVQGLRNEFGLIWRPNTFLNVFAPKAMIYKDTKLLIESVSLERSDGDKASLKAVLPETYSGEIPSTLPWLN